MTYMRIAHDPAMRMLLNNFMHLDRQTERRCSWAPATNIIESEQHFVVEMAVPGYDKADFRISLEKDLLSISSEIKEEPQQEDAAGASYRMREFSRKNFCRSFRVSESIDKEGIKAEYLNGILSVSLPKKEEVKVKKEISVL